MTVKEIREAVKRTLITQGGKFYGYNANNLCELGANSIQIQNAVNYFKYSPQQENFRQQYMA